MKTTILRITIAATFILALAGCQSASKQAHQVAEKSTATLASAELFWQQSGQVTAQTDTKGVTSRKLTSTKTAATPQVLITRKDALGLTATKTSYPKIKDALVPAGSADKLASIKLLNQLLKTAGAKQTLTSLNQLTVYANSSGNPEGHGYVVINSQLYQLPLTYTPGRETYAAIYRRDGQKRPSKTSIAKLSGRWQASAGNTTQMRVSGGWLYQVHNTGSFTNVARTKLQDLSQLSAAKTYTGQYQTMLTKAMTYGYVMPKATTIASSDGSMLYLFLDSRHMVEISASGVVQFTRSNVGADETKWPAAITQIFAAAAKRDLVQEALSVMTLTNGTYEVASNIADNVTQPYLRDQLDYQYAYVKNGQVTFKDVQ